MTKLKDKSAENKGRKSKEKTEHEEKVELLKDLVKGMPQEAIFQISKGIYLGAGGFIVKENGKTYKIPFSEAEESEILKRKLKDVEPEDLKLCMKTRELYNELKNIEDLSEFDKKMTLGNMLMMLSEKEMSPGFCIDTSGMKNRKNNHGVFIIREFPLLRPEEAPPLPKAFRNIKDVENFANSLVDYLNQETGLKVKVKIKDIREERPELVNTPVAIGYYAGITNSGEIELVLNPELVRKIPPENILLVIAHEYGHAFTADYVKVLASAQDSMSAILKNATDEDEIDKKTKAGYLVNAMSQLTEIMADTVARIIIKDLYDENLYEKGMTYLYEQIKASGVEITNMETNKPQKILFANPTQEARTSTTVYDEPSVQFEVVPDNNNGEFPNKRLVRRVGR